MPKDPPSSMTHSISQTKRARHRSPESQADFKAQLLAHAKQLYLEKGFEAMSIRALTEAFSMSPMSFYGYFESKHDLARHIWIDFFQELLGELLAAGQGKRSPVQVLSAHVHTFIAYWENHPDRYRMVYMADLRTEADQASMIKVGDHPIYKQLAMLARERVMACAYGKPVPERTVRLQCDLMLAKAVGYLHTVIAMRRYAISDREAFKKALVKDIVNTVVEASDE
jgi:AcrR family transcriptional regulator